MKYFGSVCTEWPHTYCTYVETRKYLVFLDFKVFIEDSYEVVQANNIYFQRVDTVNFHLMYY